MRKHYYSPESIERLTELGATDEEFEIIEGHVVDLAKNPKLGYRIPFVLKEEVYRFDVGRFGLIYMFTSRRLDVLTVLL